MHAGYRWSFVWIGLLGFFTISAIRVTTVALAMVSLHNELLLQSLSGSG
jgi:hypothetical protein